VGSIPSASTIYENDYSYE